MLLIDQGSETKLMAALETLRAEPDNSRCIYFSQMGKPAITGLKEKIIEAAKQHIASVDTKLYLCGDGDIFILAPLIHSKDGKHFILDVASYANLPAGDDWVLFHDVAPQVNRLLTIVEQKVEKLHKAEEEKHKLQEQQQHERKRHAILNGGGKHTSEDIKNRRARHATPELMIIEDDVFSRRLVENVLQKHYPLTALDNADQALSTYAIKAPDMLFLDINLPDVTGHELLEKIIALDPQAYVIMLSGNADQTNIVQAMSKGAKGFIAKPFTRDKLFQYINRCPTIKH